MTRQENDSKRNLRQIFLEVIELPEGARHAALTRSCGGDAELIAEVESLIRADVSAQGFLANPTAAWMTPEMYAHPGGESTTTPMVNRKIGNYKLIELIGEGGFGSVYLAEQEQPIARRVALKIIKLGMDTREVVSRFEHERQALAMMDHPNIARVIDAGTTDEGRPFFVMDLVEGLPIVRYCDEQKLNIHDRLALIAQVCDAVQHAHTKGIIHRDIKPSNVLVSTIGSKPLIKVIDFGIAKATSASLAERTYLTRQIGLVGTPEYMSPEQAEGRLDVDTRTDIYSIGVLLYELLTGSTPLNQEQLRSLAYPDIQRMIREIEPPKPSTRLQQSKQASTMIAAQRQMDLRQLQSKIRGELDWIVMRAVQKDRTHRYETAQAFWLDIQRYLQGKAVHAAPPSNVYVLKKFAKRHRTGVAVGVCVAASLFIGMLGFAWQSNITRQQRDRAVIAEAMSNQRAEELKQVSDFQTRMLEQIDATRAGKMLTEDVVALFRAASTKSDVSQAQQADEVEAFERYWSRVNATDAAKTLIDKNILKQAVVALDQNFSSQPAVQAQLRQVLADRYADLGLYDSAAPLQQEVLATRRHVFGEAHIDTLTSIYKQARLFILQGNLSAAEPLCREVLDRSRSQLDDGNPLTIKALNSMGSLLTRQHRPKEAEAMFREMLRCSKNALGEDHLDTLSAMNNLGVTLKAQGKLAEAEQYYLAVVERRRRVLGKDHPETLLSIRNMGGLLFVQDRLAEAQPYYQEAMDGYRRVLGDNHPDTLNAINSMGAVMENQGNLQEAGAYYQEALQRSRLVLGNDHPHTVAALNNLGGWLVGQGELVESRTLLQEALDTRERLLGPDHPDTLLSICNMGRLFVAIQQPDAAVELLLPAEVALRALPSGQYVALQAQFLHYLGSAHSQCGMFCEAEVELCDAYQLAQESSAQWRTGTLEVNNALADLYTRWDTAEPGAGHDSDAARYQLQRR